MSSKFVCFEALESRRLMSASAMPLAMADHAERASKVHLTVPQINGAVFQGSATSATDSHGSAVTFTVLSEAKTGKLTGTLIVAGGGDNGGDKVFAVKGSVNIHGVFTLTATSSNHETAKLTGTLSANGQTMAGKFTAHKPHHPTDNGTFTASRS